MISVIITTLSKSYLLKNTLDTLVKQNFPKEKYEIVVVDNNSTDDTKQVTLDFINQHAAYDIKYVLEPIPGTISARHRGVFESKYDILAYTDEDVDVDSGWLSAIAKAFEDTNVMIVGGRSLPKYEIDPPNWLEWFWIKTDKGRSCGWLSLLDYGDKLQDIDPMDVWGLNYSIRRSALLELGGFHPDAISEHLFVYGGDGETGLSLKAIEKGLKTVYQPLALLYHIIPKGRLTHDYFRKRAMLQGKCDSYTLIRKQGKAPGISSMLNTRLADFRFSLGKLRRKLLGTTLTEEQLLKLDFNNSYRKGFAKHQQAVRNNPELLKWVLKPDYWDYTLPKVELE